MGALTGPREILSTFREGSHFIIKTSYEFGNNPLQQSPSAGCICAGDPMGPAHRPAETCSGGSGRKGQFRTDCAQVLCSALAHLPSPVRHHPSQWICQPVNAHII